MDFDFDEYKMSIPLFIEYPQIIYETTQLHGVFTPISRLTRGLLYYGPLYLFKETFDIRSYKYDF